MVLACDEVDGTAATGIEMQRHRGICRIDGDDHALTARRTLEDELLRLTDQLVVVAHAERLGTVGSEARRHQRRDPIRQLVPFRRSESGTQLVVAVLLLALDAPLAAVIDAGHAVHAKEQAVQGTEVALVRKLGRDARHVVVVDEGEQVLARVEVPGLVTALTLERVGDLVHVGRIHGRPHALVGLVVVDGVAGVVVQPLVVVAEHRLADQRELLAALVGKRVGNLAQVAEEAQVQAEGYVQAQAVDVELALPAADHIGEILVELEIAVVELDEMGVAAPVFVAEAVVVLVVAAPVDREPASIGARLLLLHHVLEGPEAASHMVEDAVEEHADARLMEGLDHAAQILVGTEARINLGVVARVIAVAIALEGRVEHHAGCAELLDMANPAVVNDVEQTMPVCRMRADRSLPLGAAVVAPRRAAQPERIDLIDRRTLIPVHIVPPFLRTGLARLVDPLRHTA